MSVRRATVHAKWVVGRVIGTKMQKTAKVRVTRLVLDPYLLKVSSEHSRACYVSKFYTNNRTLFDTNIINVNTHAKVVFGFCIWKQISLTLKVQSESMQCKISAIMLSIFVTEQVCRFTGDAKM